MGDMFVKFLVSRAIGENNKISLYSSFFVQEQVSIM